MSEWRMKRVRDADAEAVYSLMRQHHLVLDHPVLAAQACSALHGADHYIVVDGEDKVADVFVSNLIPGEQASLDIVPVSRYFRTEFDEAWNEAFKGLLIELFVSEDVRRITAMFPESRPRTKRALSSLGFEPEGRLPEGVKRFGQPAEDLRIMGLLKSRWQKKVA